MSAPTLPIDHAAAVTERPSGSAIIFEDVHLAFEENEVLRGVSFHLPFGSQLCSASRDPASTILKLGRAAPATVRTNHRAGKRSHHDA
jgi:hypothetical protein